MVGLHTKHCNLVQDWQRTKPEEGRSIWPGCLQRPTIHIHGIQCTGHSTELREEWQLCGMERREVRGPGGLGSHLGWLLRGTDPQMPIYHSGSHHHLENGRIKICKVLSPPPFEESYIVFLIYKTFIIFEIFMDPVEFPLFTPFERCAKLSLGLGRSPLIHV